MNKIIERDILNITNGLVLHQVNCQKVCGAGLAKKIADKYPYWKFIYKQCNKSVGDIHFVNITDNLKIVNLYAQDNYGKGLQTDYSALKTCFGKFMENYYLWYYPQPFYLPYKIGCGLGGGDWSIVSEIIFETMPNAIICQEKTSTSYPNVTERNK